MGITLWALLTNRDQLEDVKADRKLLDNAIEEAVRWNATDPVLSRLVARDTELCGVHVPAGAVLEICLGAANRDPARFTRPMSSIFTVHGNLTWASAWAHMCPWGVTWPGAR